MVRALFILLVATILILKGFFLKISNLTHVGWVGPYNGLGWIENISQPNSYTPLTKTNTSIKGLGSNGPSPIAWSKLIIY